MGLVRAPLSVVGESLGWLVRAMAAVRRPAKPMHPYGAVRDGRLVPYGGSTGVAFLDETAVVEVVARESRAIGLPEGWPDVHGLAVRVPLAGGGHGDLLLSTTGSGPLTRHLLTLTRRQEAGRMSTLFPFRTVIGAVVVSARYRTPEVVELAWAREGEGWQPFADLMLGERRGDDPDLVFDAVLHTLPGLEQYDAVRRVREPSYARARASRA